MEIIRLRYPPKSALVFEGSGLLTPVIYLLRYMKSVTFSVCLLSLNYAGRRRFIER